MCGIAGIFELGQKRAALTELRRMAALLAHRGPDGEGYHIDGALGFAHRRLAVIDPDGGDQPMSSPDGRYTIVFVGEIYNFLELRAELRQWGRDFATDSDTEVILAAYAEWGEDCQNRFNGMWSFALWDRDLRRLFLSRDRFGVKPLYYSCDHERLVFSSELKGFLGLAGFDPATLALAIANYPVLDATELSLLRGVYRLRPGHSLSLASGGRPVVRRWWRTLDHLRPVPLEPERQSAAFRDLFVDACALRMRSDVPLATALSGGVDSSAVHCAMVAAARRHGAQRRPADWRKAFIGGFAGTSQDETRYALRVARHAGSETIVVEIAAAEVIDRLPAIVYSAEAIHDLPSPAWLLYRAMPKAGIRVSLDGHGGDELFGGYHHHVGELMTHTGDERVRRRLGSALAAMRADNPEGFGTARLETAAFLNQEPKAVEFPELMADEADIRRLDPLTRRLYMDFHYWTLPNILENFDRAAMAHGVEIRAPFLDWRIVCFAHALPGEAKVGDGLTKYLLRAALRDLMPEEIVLRRSKLGFVTPFSAWIGGRLGDFMLDLTSDRGFLEEPLWDGPRIHAAAIEAVAAGDGLTARRLWPFVQARLLQVAFREAAPSRGVPMPAQ